VVAPPRQGRRRRAPEIGDRLSAVSELRGAPVSQGTARAGRSRKATALIA